ncbi:hypothetical protein [Parabacteroides goldsteinii]|uniref:hypothetical protein n=1 Tax=Parabacteroides goldsteinii TaxID=328812 RepID=UPI003AF14D2D
MTIEGIELTDEMIDNIGFLQEDDGTMENLLRVFDKAIAFIATETEGTGQESMAKALRLVSDLCHIKDIFASLEGKEDAL